MSNSYTPKNVDTVAVSALFAAYEQEVWDSEVPPIEAPFDINDNYTKAMIDSFLQSMSYKVQQNAAALGPATTTSASYVDIGDGTSTGFPIYSIIPPVTKTYMCSVDIATYASSSICTGQFQLIANGITYTPAACIVDQPVVAILTRISFKVPIILTAGISNTINVQWKRLSGIGTLAVNTNCERTITIEG